MTTIADIRRAALRSLIPPPRIALSQWIEGLAPYRPSLLAVAAVRSAAARMSARPRRYQMSGSGGSGSTMSFSPNFHSMLIVLI
jgi:hypothetical protein